MIGQAVADEAVQGLLFMIRTMTTTSILRDIFPLTVFFLPFARTLFCGNSDNHYNLTEGKSCHHPRRKSPFFTNVKKRRFIVISHMRQKVNTEMNCVALKKLSAAQMLRRLVLDELFDINFLLCQILNPIIFTTYLTHYLTQAAM